MNSQSTLKFISKSIITPEEYSQVNTLMKSCQKEGQVNVKLELDFKLSLTKNNLNNSKQTEFFCYADDTLISYLGICDFGGELYELTGITHPQWRRQHIFKKLLQLAIIELKADNKSKVLVLTDHNSFSGNAFLQSLGATYSVSEYRMRLLYASNDVPHSFLSLRKAELTDRSELKRMNYEFFQDRSDAEEEGSDLIKIDSTYLIYNNDQLIGKICIDTNDSYAFLYGFGVLSEFRGQGLGTIALQKSVDLIRSKGIKIIELDVAAANERALHIYMNCGFVKQSVMDYYELTF